MNLTSFCESRNVKTNAVANYIARHPELFEGHIIKKGNMTEFDNIAMQHLEAKYPLPQPITIINGVPHEEHEALLKKMNSQSELIIRLQQQLSDVQLELASKDAKIELLGYKEETKDKIIADKEKVAENALNELKKANEEIDRLKNRGLLERLLNK